MNNRYFVPIIAFTFLGFMMVLLLVVVVVRPWGNHDNSWATHLNLTDEPLEGYSRSVQTFVSEEGSAPILVWEQKGCGDVADASGGCDSDPATEWIVRGCAGCHGLSGEGAAVGPNIQQVADVDFLDRIRFGANGMPAFDPLDLSDEHIALLADYLRQVRLTNPAPVDPTPTVQPTATAVPAQPTAVGPSPTSPANPPDDDSLALGKLVYDETAGGVGCAECHGLDGKGQGRRGESAPNIVGASRTAVREALRGAFDMQDIKLTGDELAAVIEYLQFLVEQQ